MKVGQQTDILFTISIKALNDLQLRKTFIHRVEKLRTFTNIVMTHKTIRN